MRQEAAMPRLTPLAALMFVAWCVPSLAKEDAPRAKAQAAIENCVSREWITLGSGDMSAVLDDADHRMVSSAILRLYPVVEHDGWAPQRLMLWQKRSGEVLYIALLPNPNKPSDACFTATFAATRIDATLMLRRKYFFGSVAKE
jgi:hypothetical protein